MGFDSTYEELKRMFKKEAAREDSVFIPLIRPEGPVDFVLVGMEPSLGSWASSDPQKARYEARKKLKQGFKNFAWSMEDYILHFCVRRYLCRGGATYYITDLAKGAMYTKRAARERRERYERWYPILERELGLVAKPGAKIISIGNAVGSYLSEKALFGHAGTILHYSSQASKSRKSEPSRQPTAYSEFSSSVELSHVVETAEDVLKEGKVHSELRAEILGRLQRSGSLSESRKMLMFTYRVRFERIRNQERSG